ncbi:MAG: WG repeat-containing protein [Ferruginibacter sp.]|nr:WG repeat-containing protein [Ferruginibacter sp.]
MAPVYIDKYVGFIDKTGKEVVPVTYEDDYLTDEFADGLAIVTKNGLKGLVDKMGKLIVPCEYKQIGAFSEGLAEAYKADGKVGFINTQGKTIIPFQYSITVIYGGVKCINGMIPVRNSAGKYGYIDKNNKLIVPFLYEVIQNFSDGLAMVKRIYNGKVSYLNTKGETVIAEKYNDGTQFINGTAYVNIGAKEKSLFYGLEGGKWGVIDKTGKELIPIVYDKIYEIKNGLTIVANGKYPNEKKGLIRNDGKIILPVEYYNIKILKDRIVANKVFVEPYALFDYNGNQIGDFTWYLYDIFPEITEGLLRVQELKNNKLGKVGAIDANGVLKIPLTYDAMTAFNEGLSIVSINKKYGAIDKTGKVIIPLQYESMFTFSEGWAPIVQNGKSGFINKAGKLMLFSKNAAQTGASEKKPETNANYQLKEKLFDFLMVANNVVDGNVQGEKTGGKFGILSNDEKVIIPLKYDWISIDTGNKVFFLYEGWKAFYGNNKVRFDTTNTGKIGIADYAGKEKFPFTIGGITLQKNKHIKVRDFSTAKWGVLNSKVKLIIPFSYDLIYDFADSVLAVKKNGKFGIINLKNEILVPFEYETLYTGGNKAPGGYQLRKNDKTIWVDAKGRIIQTTLDEAKTAKTNATTASVLLDENFDNNNNKWGVWDNDGSSGQLYNGNYRFTSKNSNDYLSWYGLPALATDQSKDFAIETKMFLNSAETVNNNKSYWLLWGLGNNGKSYYAFGIYPEGKFKYGKNVNGSWDDKTGPIFNAAINAGIGKANVLRVEKKKDNVLFFINGVEVYKTTYEPFNSTHSGIGFLVNNKMQIDIDYLKIYQGTTSGASSSSSAIVSPQPYESDYQKKISLAANSNERADAIISYYQALRLLNYTDGQIENLLGQKFIQMMEIDYYGFLNVLLSKKIKWDDVQLCMKASKVLTAEQRAAIKTISQYTIDDFTATQNNTAKPPYPAGVPQPGYGWGKTVSSNKVATSANTFSKPIESKPVQIDELTRLKNEVNDLKGKWVYLSRQGKHFYVPKDYMVTSLTDQIMLKEILASSTYDSYKARNVFSLRYSDASTYTLPVTELANALYTKTNSYTVTRIYQCSGCLGRGGTWNNNTRLGATCTTCGGSGCVSSMNGQGYSNMPYADFFY